MQVIRQQLHVGYDLLLDMGKQQQQQQQQEAAPPGRACVVWDEHASGAQLQSLAMLPALLTTPCLHTHLKVPLQSLVRMCRAQTEAPGESKARQQGDGQQQQGQQQQQQRVVQEQSQLAWQQQAQSEQQQGLDLEQQAVHQQQPGKHEGASKRSWAELRAGSGAPGTELEGASQHSKRHKLDPQDSSTTRGQESSSRPAHSCRSVGPFVCSVRLEDLQVNTQRVHRVCGRPVVQQDLGDLLAMMMDSQECAEPSQSQGRQEQSRPPHSPAGVPPHQGRAEAAQAQHAQGMLHGQQQQQQQQRQQQQQQQQACGQDPPLQQPPKEFDSHVRH
ncbi:hypothetical protein DUNSADRAFT_7425 [Dunaliella salina]|uniref:Uncharacterized protein n=1 Tax=Dunaliella salina TaxID=3046 RepID=A0ABQ7GLK2_DUNSA|nr:hypothetical protein DUNSADRAFT_7425 [Dunaliella salina]|eukprot:KAF5835437.1 hypothetical protein DUNSADRAFT_7425 [Dunaliella salina]